MSKGKKNWLMILIYAGLIAMCLGIVWFVGKIFLTDKTGQRKQQRDDDGADRRIAGRGT